MDEPRFLTNSDFNAILDRAGHEAEVRRDVLGYLHHAENLLRLDRRGKRPNEHFTQVALADQYLPQFREKYRSQS